MTYPLDTLAAQITSTGITAPSYNDIWLSLQASFQIIYGADAYIEADSQDGQWLAIFARAIHDSNQTAIAVYNSFRPGGALGEGLSSIVKINGIARHVASYSTADVTLTGTVGTTITNGLLTDDNGNRWALPASVTIGSGGTVTATATCQVLGAIAAGANTITGIFTPVRGWLTVTNPAAATEGAPIESDAALRRRQALSVSLPAQPVLAAIIAGIANLDAVQMVDGHENDTGTTDALGIPAHSIAIVADGGDSTAIATEIVNRKTPGTGTYGTTSVTITDSSGFGKTVAFFRPTEAPITVEIDITVDDGYTSAMGTAAAQAVADYINALGFGDDVRFSRLYTPANSGGDPYTVDEIRIARDSDPPAAANIALNFHSRATCAVADITLTVA